ncbi:phosphate ABC transporter substrate-binding protein [Thioalkalivibrio sulfidiphilus]|uniref:phosphate ABC transporter substrate-binding protein n=1 Tax=Thioalkalivibrio sulfidiphilus TaxID=1033854 RepID=UPI003BB01269
MTFIKKAVAGGLIGAALFCNAALAELAIIGHPGISLRGVTHDEVSKVYLGTLSSLEGVSVRPVDQAVGSQARSEFYGKVAGMGEAQLARYWSQRMFSGKGRPPPTVADDAAVKDWVIRTPGGIGYIDSSAVDGSVKVLSIVP